MGKHMTYSSSQAQGQESGSDDDIWFQCDLVEQDISNAGTLVPQEENRDTAQALIIQSLFSSLTEPGEIQELTLWGNAMDNFLANFGFVIKITIGSKDDFSVAEKRDPPSKGFIFGEGKPTDKLPELVPQDLPSSDLCLFGFATQVARSTPKEKTNLSGKVHVTGQNDGTHDGGAGKRPSRTCPTRCGPSKSFRAIAWDSVQCVAS